MKTKSKVKVGLSPSSAAESQSSLSCVRDSAKKVIQALRCYYKEQATIDDLWSDDDPEVSEFAALQLFFFAHLFGKDKAAGTKFVINLVTALHARYHTKIVETPCYEARTDMVRMLGDK